MARDPITELLEDPDRPVAPRPAFADALRRRLLAELAAKPEDAARTEVRRGLGSVPPAPRVEPVRLWPRGGDASPRRWRQMVELATVAVLLLALLGGLSALRPGNRRLFAPAKPTPSHDVPMFGGDPTHIGAQPGPGPVGQPRQLWSRATVGPIGSSPAVVDGVVYVGSGDGVLYALDAATGATHWQVAIGSAVESSPAVVDGVVYVGSDDGFLYAIDAATHAPRWRFGTGAAIQSSPAVVAGVVYVGSEDGFLYAVAAATGEVRWRFETGNIIDSSPAVANGVVYVGSYDHAVYAVDAATGKERWRFRTSQPVGSSPAVADGMVYVGSNDRSLYALDAQTGQQRWRFNLGSPAYGVAPAVAHGLVYAGGFGGTLFAIDVATGRKRWSVKAGRYGIPSVAVVGDLVYVGNGWAQGIPEFVDYSLGLDALTGAERWRAPTGHCASLPAVVDGVVYCGSGGDNYGVYAWTGGASTAANTKAALTRTSSS